MNKKDNQDKDGESLDSIAVAINEENLIDVTEDIKVLKHGNKTLDFEKFKCNECDYTSHSNHGLKGHTGRQHKKKQQSELFRA